MAQAAGSWSRDACCAVPGNTCDRQNNRCIDRASSSDWLFGLWPGPPQRFEPTGTDTDYQVVYADRWPGWGGDDLDIGTSGAPGGSHGYCDQGGTYRGTHGEICGGEYNWCDQGRTYRGKVNTGGEICGGDRNWGATDVEVWYPRTGH